jgi:shikimate dehydrogenase
VEGQEGPLNPERELALLGTGIAHSLSPPTWNGVFQELGLPWRYGLLDVGADGLDDALARLRDGRVGGYNVTMPHKAWAFGVATRPDDRAERARVANWLAADGDDLVAANTDAEGAEALLNAAGPIRHALVLGAGGAAAAILVALEARTFRVTLANRTRARADELAARATSWLPELRVVDWAARHGAAADADLIVNATSFGMASDPESPLDAVPESTGLHVYDLVYGHGTTALVAQGLERGAAVADGLAHLEAQGVALLPHLGLPIDHAEKVRAHLAMAAGRAPLRWAHAAGDAG